MSRIIVPVLLIVVLLGSTWLLFAPASDPQPDIAPREVPPKAPPATRPRRPARTFFLETR